MSETTFGSRTPVEEPSTNKLRWYERLLAVVVGIGVSRSGILDPVFQKVGGWLGFSRQQETHAATDSSPASTSQPKPTERIGIIPGDQPAQSLPPGPATTRER